MRKELKAIGSDKRHSFVATFERFGKKNGRNGEVKTVLLVDVKCGGKVVCDHLWFTCGKQFESLHLTKGDEVMFDARVAKYTKGYKGYRDDVWDAPINTDWKLARPTNVRLAYRGLGDGPLPLFAIGCIPDDEPELF